LQDLTYGWAISFPDWKRDCLRLRPVNELFRFPDLVTFMLQISQKISIFPCFKYDTSFVLDNDESIMGKAVEITDANFDKEVLASNVPVLVDFWAIWCGPCKLIAPIVEDIAEKYNGQVKVGKLDVDKSRQIPIKYGIRSIPTLLIFKKGQVVEQIIGAVPKDQLLKKLDRHL